MEINSIEELSEIGLSEENISMILDIPIKDIKGKYAKEYKKGKSKGVLNVLKKLHEKAMDGDYRSIELFIKICGTQEINKIDELELDYKDLIEATNAYNTLVKCSK